MPNMSPKKAPMPTQEPNVRNKNFLEVAPVSVGESFMGAFGMGSSSPAGTSSSNSVGSVSSGMSSIGSNTVNNVTVTTPYSYK